MANTTIPIHKLFRVYETLDQFDAEANHPENKICFIKDKKIIYSVYFLSYPTTSPKNIWRFYNVIR